MMCQFVHHKTFVFHEHSKLESSTSLPGGNLVDGLPPVVSRGPFEIFFVISEKFRLRILMKPRAFYIIRFEKFENHSGTPRKNREQC